MTSFRKKEPKRRSGVATSVSGYSHHKGKLWEDFNGRCAYCDGNAEFSGENYHIDHFAPKERFKESHPDRIHEYKNLMLACPFCNGAKSHKWETSDFDNGVNGDVGFLRPCEIVYAEQFARLETGEIVAKSKIGEWMHRELHLALKRHSVLWKLDNIEKKIEELCEINPDAVEVDALRVQAHKLGNELRKSKRDKKKK